VPLIGSKEGIGHVALCFIDPGDVALVPDPAYPVYAVGTMFAGGEVYPLPLEEERGWLPVLDAVPADVAHRAKVLWINYPNNPTAATATIEFFERVVHFARRHDIAVLHDLAYADVAYDGYVPPSFLQVPGAAEVGVEFNSLSKTYNMTGWRVGMAAGNPAMVDALTRVKSNLDSGIPQAIQYMAIAAMRGPQDAVAEHNAIYQRRRNRVVDALRMIGLHVEPPKASLYIWARLPEGERSIDFAGRLLDDTGVVVTPGIGYGPQGEGYVRLSLTTPDDRIDEGLRRLASWSAVGSR
jgi:LL-diaminopimelate aminotransferase